MSLDNAEVNILLNTVLEDRRILMEAVQESHNMLREVRIVRQEIEVLRKAL